MSNHHIATCFPRSKAVIIGLLLTTVALFSTGCNAALATLSPQPSPTPTAAPVMTATATVTPVPSPTPTATSTPTDVPEPTATVDQNQNPWERDLAESRSIGTIEDEHYPEIKIDMRLHETVPDQEGVRLILQDGDIDGEYRTGARRSFDLLMEVIRSRMIQDRNSIFDKVGDSLTEAEKKQVEDYIKTARPEEIWSLISNKLGEDQNVPEALSKLVDRGGLSLGIDVYNPETNDVDQRDIVGGFNEIDIIYYNRLATDKPEVGVLYVMGSTGLEAYFSVVYDEQKGKLVMYVGLREDILARKAYNPKGIAARPVIGDQFDSVFRAVFLGPICETRGHSKWMRNITFSPQKSYPVVREAVWDFYGRDYESGIPPALVVIQD